MKKKSSIEIKLALFIFAYLQRFLEWFSNLNIKANNKLQIDMIDI
jgi:hypothetical protein